MKFVVYSLIYYRRSFTYEICLFMKEIPIQKNDIKPALSGVQGLKMIIGSISYIWYSVR